MKQEEKTEEDEAGGEEESIPFSARDSIYSPIDFPRRFYAAECERSNRLSLDVLYCRRHKNRPSILYISTIFFVLLYHHFIRLDMFFDITRTWSVYYHFSGSVPHHHHHHLARPSWVAIRFTYIEEWWIFFRTSLYHICNSFVVRPRFSIYWLFLIASLYFKTAFQKKKQQ